MREHPDPQGVQDTFGRSGRDEVGRPDRHEVDGGDDEEHTADGQQLGQRRTPERALQALLDEQWTGQAGERIGQQQADTEQDAPALRSHELREGEAVAPGRLLLGVDADAVVGGLELRERRHQLGRHRVADAGADRVRRCRSAGCHACSVTPSGSLGLVDEIRALGQQPAIHRRTADQLGVGALIDDLAVLHEDHAVGQLHGGLAVGDDENRLVRHEIPHRREDPTLHGDVDRRGRVVEHEDVRGCEQRAGERDPLALSTGEGEPLFADDRVVAVVESDDEVVDVRDLGDVLESARRRRPVRRWRGSPGWSRRTASPRRRPSRSALATRSTTARGRPGRRSAPGRCRRRAAGRSAGGRSICRIRCRRRARRSRRAGRGDRSPSGHPGHPGS